MSSLQFRLTCCEPRLVVALFILAGWPMVAHAQVRSSASKRKPVRAAAPEFKGSSTQGIFFADPAAQLSGELPSSQAALNVMETAGDKPSDVNGGSGGGEQNSAGPFAWNRVISPTSIEDLVKESKMRLDRIVTTPAAFAGGGFRSARQEFSLLSLLFAIIEVHPNEDVRWKESASVAREALSRSAANAKVGSIQTYNESKQRLLDLQDLINGSKLAGKARTDLEWSVVLDRTPLMQLLEWAQQDFVSKISANEQSFHAQGDELRRYAELIAALGKAALEEDMPDANDEDYQEFARQMMEQAQLIGVALDTDSAEQARKAAAQIGQSCQDCHDNFR